MFKSICESVYHGIESISYWVLKSGVPNGIKELASLNSFENAIKKWKPWKCPCRLCKKYAVTSLFVQVPLFQHYSKKNLIEKCELVRVDAPFRIMCLMLLDLRFLHFLVKKNCFFFFFQKLRLVLRLFEKLVHMNYHSFLAKVCYTFYMYSGKWVFSKIVNIKVYTKLKLFSCPLLSVCFPNPTKAKVVITRLMLL